MSSTAAAPQMSTGGRVFQHEALMYSGVDEFLAGTAAFLREGAAAGEPMLVVVDAAKIAMLREELGSDAEAVQFADMAGVGANPARIIPAWREVVGRPGGGGSSQKGRGWGKPGRGSPGGGGSSSPARGGGPPGCAASASRSGPSGRPPSSRSAVATRRCSTSRSPTTSASGCCAPTTSAG